MPEERILNNIAVVQRRSGNPSLARITAMKAIEINPELANMYGTIALSYADESNDEQFYNYLKQALDKGVYVWHHLDDSGFEKYRDTKRFKQLVSKYEHRK